MILSDGGEHVIVGCDPDTANDRMKMMAAIVALEVPPPDTTAILHTDSPYLFKGVTRWLAIWKAARWRTVVGKKPVPNRDLWQRLGALNAQRRITWRKVRGHARDDLNGRVDRLAKAEVAKAAKEIGLSGAARRGFRPAAA